MPLWGDGSDKLLQIEEAFSDSWLEGLNDIEHPRTKVKSPKTNGFIERFNKIIIDEFFRIAFRKKLL